MANTIRIHPTITLVANQHLQAAIERGETLSGVINRLLISQLPKPGRSTGESSKPVDLEKQLQKLLKQAAPYSTRYGDGTITFAESDEWYKLLEQIAQTKIALGIEKRSVEEFMQTQYNREYSDLLDYVEDNATRYDTNQMSTKSRNEYEERLERINVLKDRLK